MKEESLLLLSDLQRLINQVVLIDYTIIILEGDMFSILRRGCLHMAKELELAKKLAILGWIFRKGLITEDEYSRTRIHIMSEYDVITFMTA